MRFYEGYEIYFQEMGDGTGGWKIKGFRMFPVNTLAECHKMIQKLKRGYR